MLLYHTSVYCAGAYLRSMKRGPSTPFHLSLPFSSSILFPYSPFIPPSRTFFSPPSTFSRPRPLDRLPLMQLWGWGSAVSSPSAHEWSPAAKRYLVHFGLKMLLLRAVLSIYSRKFTKTFDKFISKNAYKNF